jgi:hypothetical protein
MIGMTKLGVAAFVVVAGMGLAEAAVPPPQNQCPGDCSPCLGPEDPFCGGTPDPIDDGSSKCQTCEATTDAHGNIVSMSCVVVDPGELGHLSCTVTITASKVSCKATGTVCGAASIRR